ncbi:disintegrin and metalloproteinase domain-containing protein 15 isoform X2 [Anolis carolinensis]|uniref:disintegrin and metalloproteinase domain-containing protein 15 isoform X2 n=1 Tax=Anolis carolinensis TaxID=28377 RepID=UPI002F2B460E
MGGAVLQSGLLPSCFGRDSGSRKKKKKDGLGRCWAGSSPLGRRRKRKGRIPAAARGAASSSSSSSSLSCHSSCSKSRNTSSSSRISLQADMAPGLFSCFMGFLLFLTSTTAPQGVAVLRGWSDRWGWSDRRGSWPVRPRVIWDGRSVFLQEAKLSQEGFPPRLRLALDLEGERLHLDLDQNRVGAQGLTYDLSDGSRMDTHLAGEEGKCCYQGAIQGYLGSWANVCLCSGLRGLLVVSKGRSYSLEPLEDEDGTLATRLEAVKSGGRLSNPEPGPALLRRAKRGTEEEEEAGVGIGVVELVMVADQAEYNLNGDLNRTRLRMVEIANYMDGFFRSLGLRVSLVGLEIWADRDRVVTEGSPREVLQRFLRWTEGELLPRTPHDTAQLLLGSPFSGGAFGASVQGSICSRASGGVNRDHSVSPLVMASTVSHQLGHSLGFGHDGPQCGCDGSSPNLPPGRSCIMEPPTGVMPGLTFSRCTLQQAQGLLSSDRAWCLRDAPDPAQTEGGRCGNRLLEAGEECDCGLRLECEDPCCNASTCRLAPGAQCASGGACCHQCKLRSAGAVCRAPRGECDLPEFCDGSSPRCPRNAHLEDGTPCDGGQALCQGGFCPSRLRQCQEQWGAGAVPVSDPCAASLNGQGDAQGHCGQQDNGSYIACDKRDAQCGRLQCQDGSHGAGKRTGTPGTPSCPHFLLTQFDDALDLALVQTGTSCGPGKVCLDRRCRDLSSVEAPSCQCSGRGVCNNYGHCHCHPGWAPPDCQSGGNGGSLDSGPPAPEQAGSGVSTALLLSALFLLLFALGFCLAKRIGIHKRLCRIGKGSTCHYRITQPEPRSYSHAPPERPRPPIRRQDPDLQVMPSASQACGPDKTPPPRKPLPPDPPLRTEPCGPFTAGQEPPAHRLPSRPAPPPPPSSVHFFQV